MSASADPVGGSSSEPLSERLRRCREERGMSRSELAERAGLSRPTIWAWESGKTQPRNSNLQTLAAALGITEIELAIGRESNGAGTLDEMDVLMPSAREGAELPAGLAHPHRLRIMIYAAKLGIAALAGIKAQNVKVSIEL